MKANVKSYMTAGVAIVGAGAIAMTPIAPPPATPDTGARTYEVNLAALSQAAEARQVQDSLALISGGDPFSALRGFIDGTLWAYNAPGPRAYMPVNGVIDGLVHIGEGVAASGLRLGTAAIVTPLRFLALAGAIVGGNGSQAVADLITNIVDGPLWVADPVLYGLRDVLPAPLGGPGGIIENLRNQIWLGTEEINRAILDPGAALRSFVNGTLWAYNAPGPRAYLPVNGPFDGLARVGEGAIATGMRLITASVLTPLRIIALAGTITEGNGVEALRDLITNIVDGPLWVADPVLYALRDALPAPFGGPGDLVENFRNGLWKVTEQINAVVASLLRTPGTPPANSARTSSDTIEFSAASESSISSIPNVQGLNLHQASQSNTPPQQVEQDNRDPQKETPPVDNSVPVDETVPTDPVDETVPADPEAADPVTADPETANPETEGPLTTIEKVLKPTRNLVRESLNFSKGVKSGVVRGGSQDATKAGVDETVEAAQPQADAPASESGDTGDNGTGASEQKNAGSSDGDE